MESEERRPMLESTLNSTTDQVTAIGVIKKTFPFFWQVYGSIILQFSMVFISVAFMGHSDTDSLAATGLAASIINITAIGVGSGITSGYDALASQAFGAKQFAKVGILLQQNIMFLSLAFCVVSSLWINLDIILEASKEPPHIASLTRLYLVIYIPGLLGFFLFRSLRSYIQIQRKGTIAIFSTAACVIIHIVCNVVFVTIMKLGLVGAALSSTISMVVMPLSLFIITYVKKVHKKTWFGLTIKSLINMSDLARLSLLCLVSGSMRPLVYEMTVILIGLVSNNELAAQSILYQIHAIIILCPVSWGFASNFVVGQELGGGRPHVAKKVFKVIFGLCISIGAAFCVLLTLLRHFVGRIFTSDPIVLKLIAKGAPYTGLAVMMVSATISTGFVSRGIGKPHISIFCCIIGLYIIALPVGILLTFHFKMGLVGMWIGIGSGLFVWACTELAILLFWVDFQQVSLKARERAGVNSSQISHQSENGTEHLVQRCIEAETIRETEKIHGSSASNTEDKSDLIQERRHLTHEARKYKTFSTNSHETTSVIICNQDDLQSQDITIHRSILTWTLIIKRLAMFVLALSLLIISIIIRYVFLKL